MLLNCGAREDSWESLGLQRLILKAINPEYSLEGLMLKLKLQCFSHLMQRADSLVKTLMLGKIEGKRRRGWQSMRLLDNITDMSLRKLWEIVKDREARSMCCSPWSHKKLNTATKQQQLLKTAFFPRGCICIIWIPQMDFTSKNLNIVVRITPNPDYPSARKKISHLSDHI